MAHERTHNTQVGGRIGAESSAGLLDRARQRNGGAIEGMSQWIMDSTTESPNQAGADNGAVGRSLHTDGPGRAVPDQRR